MNLFALLDEIQTIARNGLAYARDPCDLERYNRLLDIVCHYYGMSLDLPSHEVRHRFAREFGYITPKVGADAAIFNENGEILLLLRKDNGRWCLPCGWLEPNESPVEAAIRETKEETGLDVNAVELVGVFTTRPGLGTGTHTSVALVYLCEIVAGVPAISHESLDLRYWAIESMSDWHGIHLQYAQAAHEAWICRGHSHSGSYAQLLDGLG